MRSTKASFAGFAAAVLVAVLLSVPSLASTIAYCAMGGTCKLRSLTVTTNETIQGTLTTTGATSLVTSSSSTLTIGAGNCDHIYDTSACSWDRLETSGTINATGGIAGATLTSGAGVSGTVFTSSSGSGANAFAVGTNGARVDVGAGASDYLSSNGTTITSAAPFTVTGALASTTLAIGASGTAILKHLSATASLDYDLSGAGITCQDLTITVTGAATGDTAAVGIADALAATAGISFGAPWVSASNTVKLRACDVTSSNPNPAAATVRADVWQH